MEISKIWKFPISNFHSNFHKFVAKFGNFQRARQRSCQQRRVRTHGRAHPDSLTCRVHQLHTCLPPTTDSGHEHLDCRVRRVLRVPCPFVRRHCKTDVRDVLARGCRAPGTELAALGRRGADASRATCSISVLAAHARAAFMRPPTRQDNHLIQRLLQNRVRQFY